MFKHILVATDFGSSAEGAMKAAIGLATEADAQLTVAHVCEVPAYAYSLPFTPVDLAGPVTEVAEKQLKELVASIRRQLPRTDGIFKIGVPWEQILACAAESGADLIVVGTHGRRGLAHIALGSVAERVVRLSKLPVLTLRENLA
jgi:nucleotide-binding universal stress UspA family protein